MPKLNIFDIKRPCYAMASKDGKHAEITMYGDVVERHPVDWWTGKKIEGNFIAQDEFLKDLDTVKGCDSLTIRINSYGGDAVVGMMIHNRLRELARDGMRLTAVVDAVAMSAASVIMAACDTVQINPTGLVMIHRVAGFFFGYYNADELNQNVEALGQYDRALVEAYRRKTGKSADELLHMMQETTYLTGEDAVRMGFADELIEDAEPLKLAASADGTRIFAGGRTIHLAPGVFAPDFIPTAPEDAAEEPITAEPAEPEHPVAVEANTPPDVSGNPNEGGVSDMTPEELRASHPELVQAIESEAVTAERERIQAIDGIAGVFTAELVNEAKYEKPCTAQELAYRAAQQQAKQGTAFLSDLDNDVTDSNANAVPAAAAPETPAVDPDDPKALAAAGKQAAKAWLAKK